MTIKTSTHRQKAGHSVTP